MLPTAGVTLILAIFTGALLFACRGHLRGTTLMHAYLWGYISLLTLFLTEIFLSLGPVDGSFVWSKALRLVAATSTFCPAMAVLGARRPHHQAWQFIVASMWIILALPALEAIFLNRLSEMDVGPVRAWFLWVMVVVNLLIYLPTRFTLSALLVASGQIILLGSFLPGIESIPSQYVIPTALLFFLLALAAGGFAPARKTSNDFNTRWLNFRDDFGTMWALRVIERINAASQINHWPLSLTWTGFYFHTAEDNWENLSPQVKQQLQQAMDNLLRRFI